MEAFGDAIVPGEAPHGGNFRLPGMKGVAKLHQVGQNGGLERLDGVEKASRQMEALFAGAMLLQQQVAEMLFKPPDLA